MDIVHETKYIAIDGTVFKSADKCIKYEEEPAVWDVVFRSLDYRHYDCIKTFLTYEEAEKWAELNDYNGSTFGIVRKPITIIEECRACKNVFQKFIDSILGSRQ